jgi:hypothetical protein
MIAILGAAPGGRDHRPVKPPLGREDTRRVDEHDLGALVNGDAAHDRRVVCTLCETIDTLAPTSWLTSVDLPALGAPISATNPDRVGPFRRCPKEPRFQVYQSSLLS